MITGFMAFVIFFCEEATLHGDGKERPSYS